MNHHILDCMLHQWARHYLSEFREVSWPSKSLSGRLIEAAKLGIFSHGTNRCADYIEKDISDIEMVQKAIIELPLKQQHIIKAEYALPGTRKAKAKHLGLQYATYKTNLWRAKKKLMQII